MVTQLATTLVIVLLTGLLIRAWLTLRRVNRTCGELGAELERARWIEWWTKNAAEMTVLDAGKPHMQRLAYAAQLAPSLAAFAADCERLAFDEHAPAELRSAAAGFAAELKQPRLPWVVWVEETGKPAHAATAIALVYRDAITGRGSSPGQLLVNVPQ